LRDLHILLAVVQHGSISKATDHLAISHPVVSKAIADLEQTLGVRLLDRSPKCIEPTMYGRAFLASSRAVFAELRQGVNITLGELLDEPWILPPFASMAGSQIQEAFQASGREVPRASLVTYSIPLRISLLATDRFLTVFPGSMLEFSDMSPLFAVLPVELPANPRPAGIVTLKGRTLSSLAKLFIECARKIVKPSVKGTS
jgi:DNA-binding transcriptional LysR family regulator